MLSLRSKSTIATAACLAVQTPRCSRTIITTTSIGGNGSGCGRHAGLWKRAHHVPASMTAMLLDTVVHRSYLPSQVQQVFPSYIYTYRITI